MDKTAIKNFAIEARKILMKSAIAEAGFYGVSKDEVKEPIQRGKDFEVYETLAGTEKRIFGDDIKRRENLVNAVKELGFEQVIEETAYTWFNRIIAIRFMEVNNYLPTRVRVLSSETGSSTPDIVTQADTVELNMSADELERVHQAKQDNKYDEAFRLLFIKQCNELNDILPGLFEKTNDYMELLLKIPYTGDGVIRMLVDTVPEDNFNVEKEGQVEIIGWMYQYYNTELKDDTFAKLKKNVKITKERIPAATQLFTPDWIVRYMVENSLGRVWIEHLRAVDSSVDEKSKAEEFGWKYYLPEAKQEEDVAAQLVDIRASYKNLTPQDITCIDPCIGSGHILVYMFDVLMDIYRSEGFSEREAVFDILEKNIRGLDIDRRAYQLSYFALMMKARGYNRIFFRGHENLDGERVQAVPQVYAIEESNSINRDQLQYFGSGMSEVERNNATNQLTGLLDQLIDAKEYGSILKIENYDWYLLKKFVNNYEFSGQMDLAMIGIEYTQMKLLKSVVLGEILSKCYHVVTTNPPYMASSGMADKLTKYVKKKYPRSKSDMYALFIERCLEYVNETGYVGMITMQTWMFIGSYEKLRKNIIDTASIVNLLQLGIKAFDEIGNDVVQTASFILTKAINNGYRGVYHQLTTHDREEKQRYFFSREKESILSQDIFKELPGYPIAYWIPEPLISIFKNSRNIAYYSTCKIGIQTGNNELFVRYWSEVDSKTIFSDNATEPLESYKWFFYTKGGTYRKWYGNNDLVVEWKDRGDAIRKYNKLSKINDEFYYKKCISWGLVSSAGLNFRYVDDNSHVIGNGGPVAFSSDEKMNLYILGLLNSRVTQYISNMLNPTINMSVGTVGAIPVVKSEEYYDEIIDLVRECIAICKEDWDSTEKSIDFKHHPLIIGNSVENALKRLGNERKARFDRLKSIEEYLNSLFISLYGLEGIINSDVDAKYVSTTQTTEREEVESLISYFVGCLFGRYSLKTDGLLCTNNEVDYGLYGNFHPDRDNIIPITDEAYLEDDIVNRFVEFIVIAYGEKTKEENLEYISRTLDKDSVNYKDTLRKYFQNEFYDVHCSNYMVALSGKRPIYWMFDSGESNGFKCLVYAHRYDKDLVGVIRTDYLGKVQVAIENALKNAEYIISSSASAVDKAAATRRKDKYIKQLNEIKIYYQALSHIAVQRMELNLDDGIKANYSRFQNIEVINENGKKQRIDLLSKI